MFKTPKLDRSVDGIKISFILVITISLLIYSASAFMWWNYLYMRDSRVYWGAVSNALSTNGVTKTKIQEFDGVTQTEKMSLSFGVPTGILASSDTVLANGEHTKSESVSTRTKEFARYIELPASFTKANNDVSKIKNVWVNTSEENVVESKLFGDQLTDDQLVFLGNLQKIDRDAFVAMLKDKKVFQVVGKSRDDTINSKKVSVYRVEINVNEYNAALARYFELMQMPESAKQVATSLDNSRPTFEIAIVPLTREIVAAGYPNITKTTEVFSLWGVTKEIIVPTEGMSMAELQKRVGELQ